MIRLAALQYFFCQKLKPSNSSQRRQDPLLTVYAHAIAIFLHPAGLSGRSLGAIGLGRLKGQWTFFLQTSQSFSSDPMCANANVCDSHSDMLLQKIQVLHKLASQRPDDSCKSETNSSIAAIPHAVDVFSQDFAATGRIIVPVHLPGILEYDESLPTSNPELRDSTLHTFG